ncbi:MAG: prepilin-type N-terminal cleavage/methylation domain-containing protein [Pseudomonadota bacterium]
MANRAAKVGTPISRGEMAGRRSSGTRGYALIEVLAAMAIVVLIGTLAFLAFGNQDTRRLEVDAAEVAMLLQEARMRALEAGRPIEIVLSAQDGVLDAGGRQVAFDGGVTVAPTRADIIMSPSGSSEGLVMTLTRNTAQKTVTLDWLTGRVRIQ